MSYILRQHPARTLLGNAQPLPSPDLLLDRLHEGHLSHGDGFGPLGLVFQLSPAF
jgi:hypothetical protein